MNVVSEISLVWYLPLLLVSAGLSFWFYRNQPWMKEVSKRIKYLLLVLRFAALSLLFLLLFGILFKSIDLREEKPIFIQLFDASSSMLNYKDSARVKQQIAAYRAAFDEQFGERFDLVSYAVGSDFRKISLLELKDQKSDLALGFEEIYQQYYNRNIGGICFVSDGNFNEGSHPFYTSEKIPMTPIFTLGVGDTSAKKDQVLRNVISNEIAFLKNKFPVEIDVEAFRMGKSSSTVSIYHKGKKVASQSITYKDGTSDFVHLSFELDATELGFQNYTVEVAAKAGEYTLKNNRTSFYVEILDARNKVLLLAGAPHPDVSALKYVLEKDENVQVESKWISDWDKNLNKVDLIVWHEPGVNYSNELAELIKKSGKPVFYVVGPNTANSTLQKLDLGMTVSASNQFDEVQAQLNEGFELFEFSDAFKNELRYFPPFKIRFGQVRLTAQNKVILNQRIGEVAKKEPLLFVGEKSYSKYAVLYGEGIWRWKMHDYLKNKGTERFEEFVQKITQYLVVKNNASSLRIKMPRRFTSNEDITIQAEFYNEAMQLITKPKVSFLLTAKTAKSTFEFAAQGNFYNLPLGKLKPGEYTWLASTTYGGKKHVKSGVFVVEKLEIEALDTKANHQVLQQISSSSNGNFMPLNQYKAQLDAIAQRKDIVSMSYEESRFNDLVDYFWVLLLIALLFSAEWFVRRWSGAY
jgi:hypothetical protein